MIIAVVAPVNPSSFFDAVWEGVWEATFDLSPFGVQVLDFMTEFFDPESQQKALTDLLEQPVDAIVLAPSHASLLDGLIVQHVSRGIPVITFHSDAPGSGRSLFVGPDAFGSGMLAGEVLIKMMGGRGRIVSFPGQLEQHVLAERYRGLRDELKHQQDTVVEIACFPEAVTNSLTITAEMLANIGEYEGIYAGSEKIVDIARCLEKLQKKILCVGFTHSEEIIPFLECRTISAVIDESRYRQGYFAIQKAYEAVLRKQEVTPTGISIPSTVIFSSNAREPEGAQSLNEAFDGLVMQRTESLRAYQALLEDANSKLEGLATTDPLTGLYNRRKFEEMLDIEIRQTRRQGELSLLMIDLNLFKIVNDKFGHLVGDEALKAVASVLKTRCRDSDICARLGGDEFAVLLPMTGDTGAKVLRSSINELMENVRIPAGNEHLTLTLSIGIATVSGQTAMAKDLVSLADQNMYLVKQAGKAGGKAC